MLCGAMRARMWRWMWTNLQRQINRAVRRLHQKGWPISLSLCILACLFSSFYRMKLFRSKLANLFASRLQDEEQIFLTDLLELINEGMDTSTLFGTAEATAACDVMQEAEEL